MALTYFKRFRMEVNLGEVDFAYKLPAGYRLIPWEESLLETHAETKYLSFREEIDSNVFPCLGDLPGCQRLMGEISRKSGFLPGATWLAACSTADGHGLEYCGTVQGIWDRSNMGAIQNLGVVPEHRGRGLGMALLLKALEGFYTVGLRKAFLEVTAQNDTAIQLYRRLGFSKARTVYKVVEAAYT